MLDLMLSKPGISFGALLGACDGPGVAEGRGVVYECWEKPEGLGIEGCGVANGFVFGEKGCEKPEGLGVADG